MNINISISIVVLKELLLSGSITINFNELTELHEYWHWEDQGFVMKQIKPNEYSLSITT